MCEIANKMLHKIDTVWTVIKIASIPDKEYVFETAFRFAASYFVTITCI